MTPTPTNLYELVELDIVQRLEVLEDGSVRVEPLPEVQGAMERPIAGNGRVTIGYVSSSFDETSSTAQIAQNERINVQVIIEAKKLRGAGGIYSIIAAVKMLLTGFRPSHCHRMAPVETKHLTYERNTWMYGITYGCTTMHVEYEEFDVLPLLREVLIDIPTTEDVNDLFYIFEGDLYIRYTIDDEFEIDENGNLVVSGPNENSYAIEGDNLVRFN